ncbi:hypothetical protein BHM03_00019647 [Ensete ventricosum]|uniref:Uncharacterized protein n=1 Tax=Ensete ventricosum TaxID=4639 RepID=A0A445MFN1_ENSVE|nr:hypothetical protein BHM03_00019647 [Ensete ventricosum]
MGGSTPTGLHIQESYCKTPRSQGTPSADPDGGLVLRKTEVSDPTRPDLGASWPQTERGLTYWP